jgi:hypothetical protein
MTRARAAAHLACRSAGSRRPGPFPATATAAGGASVRQSLVGVSAGSDSCGRRSGRVVRGSSRRLGLRGYFDPGEEACLGYVLGYWVQA